MASAIDTSKVTGRRQLHFARLDDVRAEVEQLATSKDIRALGNWSPGQVLKHLAIVMNGSIDGQLPKPPAIIRLIVRLFFKRRLLTRTMSAGYRLPANSAALVPPPTSWEHGLQSFQQAFHRLQTETKRSPSPILGPLSNEEWEQLHCRHSELHLSFLIPVG